MKRPRLFKVIHWTVASLFILIPVLVLLLGCSRSESPPQYLTGPRENSGVSVAGSQSYFTPVHLQADAEEKRVQYEQSQRQQLIASIRETFASTQVPSDEESHTPWRDGIRATERPAIFQMLCEDLDEFREMKRAVETMKDFPYNIGWEELEVKQDGAMKMYKDKGLMTVHLFLKTLDTPRATRKHITSCHQGEGSWNFADELEMFDQIAEILDAVNMSVVEVKVYPSDIRQLLIKELWLHASELEDAAFEGYISREDELDCLKFLVDNAQDKWNVPVSSLMLAPDTIKALNDRGNPSSSGCYENINLTLMR